MDVSVSEDVTVAEAYRVIPKWIDVAVDVTAWSDVGIDDTEWSDVR